MVDGMPRTWGRRRRFASRAPSACGDLPARRGARDAKTSDPDLVPLTQLDQENKKGKPERKPAKQRESKEAKPKALSCLDAAAQVLKAKGEPMQCKTMIDAMFSQKLWSSDAPTPAATLYSAILREITVKKGESRFKKTERGHFALNA